ncbi:GntR family transcriptional regulator [Actinoplanes friuliensis]|uniref:GntR family transcriptional regulator n=1 Tax=Actinoplanes friuliensis DSM 7358 TaxID=1246995 RepID=U5VZ07_9ACTN|nr:GntR family transcriptional regulator [Actinoplanes friuliensis]AGZ40965.1 GntR family transcriptional regulator [Actinoplanes friuliensis DSM 7358]
MLFRVSLGSGVPLAEQIAGNVRRALGDGMLSRGDRLPSARELAQTLDVNMHTVLRAYAALREDGLIELRRGRGAVVTGAVPHERAQAIESVRELVAVSRRAGIGLDEAIDLLRQQFAREVST